MFNSLVAVGLVTACSGGPEAAPPTAPPSGVPGPSAARTTPSAQPGASTASRAPTAGRTAAPSASPKTAARKPAKSADPNAPAKSAAPGATAKASPDSATGRIVLTDQGFAITLPTGWRRIPLDGSVLDELSAVLPPDSDMGRLLASQVGQATIAGIKLWAFDLRPASIAKGYASNVNAVVQSPNKNFGLATFREFLVAQLKSVQGITRVESTIVTIPPGEAIRTSYRVSIPMASGGSVAIGGLQFVLLGPAHTYALTFSCAIDDASCTKAADASMRTFDYLD